MGWEVDLRRAALLLRLLCCLMLGCWATTAGNAALLQPLCAHSPPFPRHGCSCMPCRRCRLVAPDPSPVPSIGLGTFGQAGGFAYETPDAMPLQPRQLMTHSGGGGRVSSGGRHMSGGGGGGLGGAGGGLGGGLNLGGGMVGQRQALQNDKRQSLGLAFPGCE